jgi:hypothetical protein
MKLKGYPEYDCNYPADELKKENKKIQVDVMREWFFENYENPVESLPYESKEGGYIFIWGGPFDAKEVLYDRFSGIVPEDVIDELVEKLEGDSIEWSGIPGRIDDYLRDAMESNTKYHETFQKNIHSIEELLSNDVKRGLKKVFYQLLYVNVITALETYLSDAFINSIMSNIELMRKFVETNPEFKSEKFCLSDIFSKMDAIENNVRKYLLDLIWHNLEKVKHMYSSTLGVDFPSIYKEILRAISVRHDIVHRNGKKKDGKDNKIAKKDVRALIFDTRTFIDDLDSQLRPHEFS